MKNELFVIINISTRKREKRSGDFQTHYYHYQKESKETIKNTSSLFFSITIILL